MIFRHEYLSLITLRKLDPQSDRYHKTKERYIPKAVETKEACQCGEEVAAAGLSCEFCSSHLQKLVDRSVSSGAVVPELKEKLQPSTTSMHALQSGQS